jgi:hypothetical protein
MLLGITRTKDEKRIVKEGLSMTPIDGDGSGQGLEDFIDPKGYWADPERNIRRTSGEQGTVLKATDTCTKAEWIFLLESLGIGGDD